MPRFTHFLPLFLFSVLVFTFLGVFLPPVTSFDQALAQLMPYPFNNFWAATVFSGILVAVAFGLALPVTPVVQRGKTRIRHQPAPIARQSLTAPMPTTNWRPLPPPVKYFGGKSRLAPKIIPRIPEHSTWVEPFAGGGSVTLAKPPSKREILVDKRVDMIRFLKHVKAGKRLIPLAVNKANFKRIQHKPESARSPSETYLLQAKSFGGHGESWADGNSAGTPTLLNKRLDRYQQRLANTQFMTGDYRTTIKRYDSPRTLYFLDPPYPRDKLQYTDYGRTIPTVQDVKSSVTGVKGKVMITYPNLPSVRQEFSHHPWRIEKLRTLNSMYASNPSAKADAPKFRNELLISNFPARDRWKPETELG